MSMMFQPVRRGSGQLGVGYSFVGTGSNSSGNRSSPYWWNDVVSLISQGLVTFGGANTGTQIISTSDGRIQAITNPQPVNQNQYQQYTPQQLAQLQQQNSLGGGVGSGIDGIINWVAQNPLIVGGAAIGLYLLFREPPRGRR